MARLIASAVFPVPPVCAITVTIIHIDHSVFRAISCRFLEGSIPLGATRKPRVLFSGCVSPRHSLVGHFQPVPRGERLLEVLWRQQPRCLENRLDRLVGMQAVKPVRERSQHLPDWSKKDVPLPVGAALVDHQTGRVAARESCASQGRPRAATPTAAPVPSRLRGKALIACSSCQSPRQGAPRVETRRGRFQARNRLRPGRATRDSR